MVTTSRTVIPNSPSELKAKSRSVTALGSFQGNRQISPEFPKSTFGKPAQDHVRPANLTQDNARGVGEYGADDKETQRELEELRRRNRELEEAVARLSAERGYQEENENTMIKERIINNDLSEKIKDLQRDYEKVVRGKW